MGRCGLLAGCLAGMLWCGVHCAEPLFPEQEKLLALLEQQQKSRAGVPKWMVLSEKRVAFIRGRVLEYWRKELAKNGGRPLFVAERYSWDYASHNHFSSILLTEQYCERISSGGWGYWESPLETVSLRRKRIPLTEEERREAAALLAAAAGVEHSMMEWADILRPDSKDLERFREWLEGGGAPAFCSVRLPDGEWKSLLNVVWGIPLETLDGVLPEPLVLHRLKLFWGKLEKASGIAEEKLVLPERIELKKKPL